MNPLVDELKEQLAKGSVVVVVGAGVSIQATENAPCASWKGLLRHGVEYGRNLGRIPAKIADLALQQIESDDLDMMISAAQVITSRLGNDYRIWLQQSVGALTATKPTVLEAVHALGATITTTNYDNLLSDVTKLPPVLWTRDADVEEVIRCHRSGVVHLHGHYDTPESVVSDLRSYHKVMDSKHATAVLNAIRTMKTLLFVGCGEGLRDPRFEAFFEWTEEALAKSPFRHFILCRDEDVDAIRAQHPPERKLYPISYGKNFDDLEPFMRSLAPAPKAVSLPTPVAAPVALLPDPGPCFGRDDEIRTIVNALLDDAPARISVLGTGGIGKTTLTLQALRDRQVATRFGARRYFVRCDPATNLDGLVSAVAEHVISGGSPQLQKAVLSALAGGGPAVLVLDNFETPWQSATIDVERYLVRLSGIESLHLIVTMRGTERPGGILWHDPVQPPLLSLAAAREAFVAIATNRFAKDPHLDTLLDAMDRLPLAITLMAHLAQREVSLLSLLERWNAQRTAMLQRAGSTEKADNIEVSFELSISSPRMTDEARRFLAMLAMLPAGLAHEDIGRLFAQGEQAAGILRATGLAFDEGDRLRLLAPLRAFVASKYPAAADDRQCVMMYFLELAATADGIGRRGGASSVVRLAAEIGNVESMILRAFSLDMREALVASTYWSRFIEVTGMGSVEVLEQSRSAAATKGDLFNHAVSVKACADVARVHDNYERAETLYKEAFELFKSADDNTGAADCLHLLASTLFMQDRVAEGEDFCKQALTLYRSERDVRGEANVVFELAEVAKARGELDSAAAQCDTALKLYVQLDHPLGIANCIKSLGDVARLRYDAIEATRRYQDAMRMYVESGVSLGEANCAFWIGLLAADARDIERAKQSLARALEIYESVATPFAIGRTHRALARLPSDPTTRRRHIDAARSAWRSIGSDELLRELDEEFGDQPTGTALPSISSS